MLFGYKEPIVAFTIRPIADYHAYVHAQEVIRQAWDDVEPIFNVPVHALAAIARQGGVLLGAFDADGPVESGGMVGIVLGWLGSGLDPADPPGSPVRLKLHSHMVGVLPAWQRQHVALRLKLAQRDAVLAQGLTEWMTWTYDPLLRRNAVFNLHRLGATSTTYMRDVFQEHGDRFQVDWYLRSPHILHDADAARSTPRWDSAELSILQRTASRTDLEAPLLPQPSLDGRPLAVPVPYDIAEIRRHDEGLAIEWRLYLRAVMEQAFAAGYTLIDCVELSQVGWHYILVHGQPEVY